MSLVLNNPLNSPKGIEIGVRPSNLDASVLEPTMYDRLKETAERRGGVSIGCYAYYEESGDPIWVNGFPDDEGQYGYGGLNAVPCCLFGLAIEADKARQRNDSVIACTLLRLGIVESVADEAVWKLLPGIAREEWWVNNTQCIAPEFGSTYKVPGHPRVSFDAVCNELKIVRGSSDAEGSFNRIRIDEATMESV